MKAVNVDYRKRMERYRKLQEISHVVSNTVLLIIGIVCLYIAYQI